MTDNDKLALLCEFWAHFSTLTDVEFKNGLKSLFEAAVDKYGEAEFKKLVFNGLLLNNYKDLRMIITINDCKTKISEKGCKIQNVQRGSALCKIPKNLLSKIFTFLDEPDLKRQEQLCRDILATARSQNSFHQKHFVFEFTDHCMVYRDLKRYFDNGKYKNIRKLTVIFNHGAIVNWNDNEGTYLKFSDVFPQIETLCIYADRPIRVRTDVYGQFNNLKNVSLNSVDFDDGYWKLYKGLALDIVSIDYDQIGYTYSNLLSLNPKVLSVFDMEPSYYNSNQLNCLEGLRLISFQPRKHSKSRFLCNAPNIQYLSIMGCGGWSDDKPYMDFGKSCNLCNVKEFYLKLEKEWELNFYLLFGWTQQNKPKRIVLDLDPASIAEFMDYNAGTYLLDSLDIIKIIINSTTLTRIFVIFETIINIWYNNGLVVPKHILLIFNIEDNAHESTKEQSLITQFNKIVQSVSKYDKKLKDCETLLLLYNGSDNIIVDEISKIRRPSMKHDSNIRLEVSCKESQISYCHDIKSPFFNQFCFGKKNSVKKASKLHEIFYAEDEIYKIKTKLNYTLSE